MKIKKKIIVKNKQGLHARPAALFVQLANKFNSQLTVSKNGRSVNGKSIMGILLLGAEKGSHISVEAHGDDAKDLISALEELVGGQE
ncbi:MAG: HPr family phosphocarrier protein [Candidatus Omnitrophica bacterium]|nr:HPr family phosphocarrier protein [Candidatus Omnitrophota bacterium]